MSKARLERPGQWKLLLPWQDPNHSMDLGSLVGAETSTGIACATAAPPCLWKVFSKEFRTTDPVTTGVPDPQPHPAFGRIFPWNSEDSATTGSADPAPWCPELGGCRERIPWDFTHGRGEGLALGLKDGVLMAFLGDCSKPGVLGVLLSHPIPPLTAPAQNLSANPAFCG